MKIFTRKSRVYRNLILGLVWFGLVAYRLNAGEEFGNMHILYIVVGMIFLFLFYMEFRNPYITIENGVLSQGFFSKNSIKLEEIEEWQTRAGMLILAGTTNKVKILPSRISQKDMERIYEVLRGPHPEDHKHGHQAKSL